MRLLPRKGVVSGDRASTTGSRLPPGTFRHLFVRYGARTYGRRSVASCRDACVTDRRCLAWTVYGENSSRGEVSSSSRMTCRLHSRRIYLRFQRVPRIQGKRVAMGLPPRFRIADACSRVSYQLYKDSLCFELEQAPLNDTCSSPDKRPLPRLYHAIGPRTRPTTVTMNAVANPSYQLNYHDDDSAPGYLRKHCGARVAEAFRCLVAPANRAESLPILRLVCRRWSVPRYGSDSHRAHRASRASLRARECGARHSTTWPVGAPDEGHRRRVPAPTLSLHGQSHRSECGCASRSCTAFAGFGTHPPCPMLCQSFGRGRHDPFGCATRVLALHGIANSRRPPRIRGASLESSFALRRSFLLSRPFHAWCSVHSGLSAPQRSPLSGPSSMMRRLGNATLLGINMALLVGCSIVLHF